MNRSARRALLGVASLVGGCVYLNSLYNAQRLFDQAERASWAGRDQEAGPLYDSVVAKAARSYREEPEGGWADDALYLLGRAYLRRGEPERAEAALRHALEISDDVELRAGSELHLGMAAAARGRPSQAMTFLNGALLVLEPGELRAEGHLWRGRVLLDAGQTDAGWWDLDRAAEVSARYRVAVGLERLRWSVVADDWDRAREAADELLAIREAGVREDTIRALLDRAADRWGPGAAVQLLARAGRAAWPPPARSRMQLQRARFLRSAGDESAALAEARPVADGAGEEVTEARLFMARVLLGRAGTADGMEAARAVLLPAVGDERVLDALEAMRMVELLVQRAGAEGPPEALFAAAEIARDDLGARGLAWFLLLRYAEVPDRAWTGKALLAALDLAAEPHQRSPLLRRMARSRHDPYIAAGRSGGPGGPPPRVLELDARLQDVLSPMVEAALREARQQGVLARERPDTVG